MVFAATAYLMVGVLVAIVSMAVTDGDVVGPPGSEAAVLFLVGLFWPLVVVAGAALLLWRATVGVLDGFVVLWRHWRRERVPRAVARDR